MPELIIDDNQNSNTPYQYDEMSLSHQAHIQTPLGHFSPLLHVSQATTNLGYYTSVSKRQKSTFLKKYYISKITNSGNSFFIKSHNDKLLINSKSSFDIQMNSSFKYFESENITKRYLEYFFNKTTNELLSMTPEELTIEMTHDASLFYTIMKGGIKIFLEFYLKQEEDEQLAMITFFQNNNKMTSFSGSVNNILAKYFQKLDTSNQTIYSMVVSD